MEMVLVANLPDLKGLLIWLLSFYWLLILKYVLFVII